jgi:hypothetical protein
MTMAKAKQSRATQNAAKQFQAKPPAILVWRGQQEWQKPRHEIRFFHRRRVEVWSGYVKTSDVKGWVDNVRIELFVDKWKRDHAGTLPTNDEILDWMLTDPYDEFDLGGLGDSIVNNGVRQSIVITADGTLLDGNRRYFSALFKLRQAQKSGDKAIIDMVSHLPAFVLSPSCTDEDLDAVLVEENFVDDCRRQWPRFIKASKVFSAYQALRENGTSRPTAVAELVERFGMKKPQVERWIKMMDFIEEFYDYHINGDDEDGRVPKDEFDVKWQAQQYFEYFDELTKPDVMRTLESDRELREKVLHRLYDEDFVNFKQIRSLPAIALDLRARDKFMRLDGKKAVEDAISWLAVTGMTKKALDVNDRIMSFLKFIGTLTANDIDKLDLRTIEALEEISAKVADMANAVKNTA